MTTTGRRSRTRRCRTHTPPHTPRYRPHPTHPPAAGEARPATNPQPSTNPTETASPRDRSSRRPTTDPPLAYRPNVAAHMLGIGRTRIYELIRSGQLATRKLGPVTLIERSELERFIASLPTGGPEPENM